MINILPSSGRSLIRKQIEAKIETKAVATLQMKKPVMSHETERKVRSALAQYKNKGKWHKWGMSYLRKQGSCILLEGPPGTGKTVIATYMAMLLKYGLKILDLSTFGSRVPGENERNLQAFFQECERDKRAIFIDEGDSVLWDRAKATDNQWMVAVINMLLTLIANYPHPLFVATNRKQDLDPAFLSRVLADIHIPRPNYDLRLALWRQKVPKQYPWQPTEVQLQELANLDLTGREIEHVLFEASGICIEENKNPTFDLICNVAKVKAAAVAAQQ